MSTQNRIQLAWKLYHDEAVFSPVRNFVEYLLYIADLLQGSTDLTMKMKNYCFLLNRIIHGSNLH